jgi:hypothetical protein
MRVRAWSRTDATGAVVLTVHYGAKPIEFERGKAAIAVGKKNKLIPMIETIIAAVDQIKRVVKFWREYIGDQSIESIGNKELSGYVRMVTRMYPWRELHESRTA